MENGPSDGKRVDVFKKDDPHEKGNYRPITVQVTVNKLFYLTITLFLNNYSASNAVMVLITSCVTN